jgi:RHS repeat-associated protein
VEYYGTDALGSVRTVFDQSGGLVERADYLPFGESVFAPGNLPSERFTGQQRDGDAALDYFHARMLQPRHGRMISPDAVNGDPESPQTWNRYAYVVGNPVSMTDPTGNDEECNQIRGAYWCPGQTGRPPYVPSDNANDAGYHGGEIAAGEDRYAARMDSVFQTLYVQQLSNELERAGTPRVAEAVVPAL